MYIYIWTLCTYARRLLKTAQILPCRCVVVFFLNFYFFFFCRRYTFSIPTLPYVIDSFTLDLFVFTCSDLCLYFVFFSNARSHIMRHLRHVTTNIVHGSSTRYGRRAIFRLSTVCPVSFFSKYMTGLTDHIVALCTRMFVYIGIQSLFIVIYGRGRNFLLEIRIFSPENSCHT